MQRRPERSDVLDAVAQFLMAELLPTVADKRLNFRVLIAANLASTVAAELRAQTQNEASEAARLRALLPDASANATAAELTAELSRRLREDRIPEAELAAVRRALLDSLRDALAVLNPRFETAEEIEP